jgi:arabinogalactan oligomer/maltooligosaccharide transport system substrate-binding protein
MRVVARTVVAVVTGAALAAGALVGASSSQAAPARIVIWADAIHAPVLAKLLAKGYNGTPVKIVTKDLAQIRDQVGKVSEASAPDVIWGDQSWSGDLGMAGTIVPVVLSKTRKKQFAANVLGGYSWNGHGYGLPVQVSNVAMISNAKLVPKQPTSFAQLSKMVAKMQAKGKGKRGFAVGQGSSSDGYAMYPLFSGLGGYFFGKDDTGSPNPSDIGLSSPTFLKNSGQINDWNAAGLINSAMGPDEARQAFVTGKAPFWIAGPGDMETLKALKFTYRITPVPTVVSGIKAVPLLRVQGFSVTKYAKIHGVGGKAKKLVTRFLAAAGRQLALAGAAGLNPANELAAKQVAEKRLVAMGAAGVGGVPVPNILQMAAVWPEYGAAWVTSTSGPDAPKAKKTFADASGNISAAIN